LRGIEVRLNISDPFECPLSCSFGAMPKNCNRSLPMFGVFIATEPQFFEDSRNIEVISCNKFLFVISFNQASGPCISKLRLQLCYLFFIYFEIFIES